MNFKAPVWVAALALVVAAGLWLAPLWRAVWRDRSQPTTFKGMEATFKENMKKAVDAAQDPEARERMLRWASEKLKLPVDQLRQQAAQFQISAPELYYAHCLRERANQPVPLEEVMELYKVDKDWYNTGNRRGAFPFGFVEDLREITKAGLGQ